MGILWPIVTWPHLLLPYTLILCFPTEHWVLFTKLAGGPSLPGLQKRSLLWEMLLSPPRKIFRTPSVLTITSLALWKFPSPGWEARPSSFAPFSVQPYWMSHHFPLSTITRPVWPAEAGRPSPVAEGCLAQAPTWSTALEAIDVPNFLGSLLSQHVTNFFTVPRGQKKINVLSICVLIIIAFWGTKPLKLKENWVLAFHSQLIIANN